jgi:hypothetical protein
MTRPELPREDLLRDAVAYSERVLLHLAAPPNPLFVGFRASGGISLYYDDDPVFQFNADGELRRAYCEKTKYAAKDGYLMQIASRPAPQQESPRIQLSMHRLPDVEEIRLRQNIENCLTRTATCLAQNEFVIEGAYPQSHASHLVERLRVALHETLLPLRVAMSPATNG